MIRKQTESAALLLDAVQMYFESDEDGLQPQERTPVHTLKPKMYAAFCNHLGVDKPTAYLMAAFAIALTKGMAENPGDIPAMCGGESSPNGGGLIVALEALKCSMSSNNKTE